MPAPGLSGGTKSNRLIAEAMARRGHHVTIAYSTVDKPWPPFWHPRTFCRRAWRTWKNRNLPKHHLEVCGSGVTLLPINHKPLRAQDVPDADVVIATWWETMEWIADWPASKGHKAYFVRGYEIFGGTPERVHRTYMLPAKKFVISTWLKRLMAEEFGDVDTTLVPNGIDHEQFNAPPRLRNTVPTVGMIAHPSTIKGAATAFQALRIAQQSRPDLRVVSFGSHPIDDIPDPPANFTFELKPAQSRIPELYRQADCWLLPSTTEGLGMPGLEAAACRCPLVVTRCGGPEDYVHEGVNGFKVPVGDAQMMARRILQVIDAAPDRWQAMSDASHRIAHAFDWDTSAKILERTLLQMLTRDNRAAHPRPHAPHLKHLNAPQPAPQAGA